MVDARPPIRWVGGKTQLLSELEKHVPPKFGRYHEPFFGGGALFFRLRSLGRVDRAVLSDANEHLVSMYRGIRDDVEAVISNLEVYRTVHSKAFFESTKRNPPGTIDAANAAWFIYLMKVCFNGLYRENKRGEYNVAFDGSKQASCIIDEPNLRACAAALRGIDVLHSHFEEVAKRVMPGDLVYLDPPYWPLSETSSFTAYTRFEFGSAEHERLEQVARGLALRGVHVILSNSSAPPVRELYSDWEIHEVSARRAVNCKAEGRGKVAELIITPRPGMKARAMKTKPTAANQHEQMELW